MSARERTPGRVLLVEDNPHEEVLILRALTRSGIPCTVEVARDGAEAVEKLLPPEPGARAATLPDLILLDLKLPKLDGLEVLARLRADPRTAHVPIVVMSSSDEPRDLRQSYHLGANSYVRKPMAYASLTRAVDLLAAYWLELNEREPPDGTP